MTARCAVCNEPSEERKFRVPPLPFFTTDQKIYVPGGLQSNECKSFPLCKNCFRRLRRGTHLIQNRLNFSIGGARGLQFWLIPMLDSSLDGTLFESIESQPIYLRNLRSVCARLEAIESVAVAEKIEKAPKVEEPPFLTYSALFYFNDRTGNMRLLTSAEGIYPSRLRKIVREKSELDGKYPYFLLHKFCPSLSKVYFGFPILADFWLHDRNGGRREKTGRQRELAELVSSVYLGSKMDTEYVNSILIQRIRNELRGAGVKVGIKKLEALTNLSLKALITVEFLEKMEVISMPESSVSPEFKSAVEDRFVKELLKFLNEHRKVIAPGVVRAVCCAGVLTGITLKEQEKKIGSTSFWSKLNRLELNFERVRSLVPQTIEKLRQYKVMDRYENLVAHILAKEISHLDESEVDKFSDDLISLVFTVGLGEGYLLSQVKTNGE